MRVALRAEVIRSLQQFYGAFDLPSYRAVGPRYDGQPYREQVTQLREAFRITETTDLNDDVL